MPLRTGSCVRISVKCPLDDSGTPVNQWGLVRETFWVVLVRVERETLWGCVNSDPRCIPMKMGSVVKFPRSRVVEVSDIATGVTTFGMEDAVYVNNNTESEHYWQRDRFTLALGEYKAGNGSEEAVLRALPVFLRELLSQGDGALEERFLRLGLALNARIRREHQGEGPPDLALLPTLEGFVQRPRR